jgi:hypothetical protein
MRQQHALPKGFVEPLVRSAIVGVIALAAVGMGLPNWLAITGLLVASALAGLERHGLTSDAVYWAISNYLVAIAASKLAHLIIIGGFIRVSGWWTIRSPRATDRLMPFST